MKNDQASRDFGSVPDLLKRRRMLLAELSRQQKAWLLSAYSDVCELQQRNDEMKRQLARLTALLDIMGRMGDAPGSAITA